MNIKGTWWNHVLKGVELLCATVLFVMDRNVSIAPSSTMSPSYYLTLHKKDMMLRTVVQIFPTPSGKTVI